MRLLEFSTETVKALHKFLGSLSMSEFDLAKLSDTEKEAVLDGYGVILVESEEIQLDEAHAEVKANEAKL